MGSGVAYGRWGIKFRLRRSGVVASWKGAAALLHPRVNLSFLRLPLSVSLWVVVSWKGAAALLHPRVNLSFLRLPLSVSLWVVVSWKGAAALHHPTVRLSSSYVSGFVYLRLRPPTPTPTSSSSSVVVCLCGSVTVICMLTVCAVFHAVWVKAFVVLWCFIIPMTNL